MKTSFWSADVADRTKRLVLLGFLRELSTGRNPERVHCPLMPQKELEVAAQLGRGHLLEAFEAHLLDNLTALRGGVSQRNELGDAPSG